MRSRAFRCSACSQAAGRNIAGPTTAELFSKSPGGLREIVRAVMQEMQEAEMTDALGAEKGEGTESRLGYAPVITPAPSSPGWASSSCACRRTVPQDRNGRVLDRALRALPALRAGAGGDIGRDGSLPSGLTRGCRASRPARSRRSPRSCAAIPSRAPPSPPSTSAWTKALTPSPDGPLPSLSLISSSTPVMRRCARAAWS